MHHAANQADFAEQGNDSFGTIVSDLISLVEHVRASISMIETAIARETSEGDHDAANVIVLDDVTPQYVKASYALNACSASLGTALQFLLDARTSSRQTAPLTAH